jgi:hypothetical protein
MKSTNFITLSLACIGLFLAGCMTMPAPADQSDYAGFEYVTNVEGLKKDALYEGVKLWVAENFRSAKQVLDFENKDQGIIICNGVIPNIVLDTGMIKMPQQAAFKMKVEVKDDKMRLSFTQYQIIGRTNDSLFKDEVAQIRAQLSKFGDSIAIYLKNPRDKSF